MSFNAKRFFSFLWRLVWVIATPIIFVSIFVVPVFTIFVKAGLIFLAAVILNIPFYIVGFIHRNYSLPIYSLPSFDRNPAAATILSILLAPVFTCVIEFRILRSYFYMIKRAIFR